MRSNGCALCLLSVGPRGAELFQATIVKAVRARLDEEHRSMEQLKRQ